ncbi:PREDICTED: uncharacterized protein LOC104608022 [Nelumbo nucifera]|uniref:Uncharacterized protein LOC104608022 n=1 Tax=Nelumbo nucifera TaxID=4432 RepID=A0A1U8AVJ9_NELNU|nr:PREDICTED: uncharacterized protein LOC104608022 [Nelumbo nucifera]
MAATVISSPVFFSFANLHCSNIPRANPKPYFHAFRLFSHSLNGWHTISPRTSICHGKLNDCSGEESGEIEETFFDDEDADDDSEEDEMESSVDLLFRFLRSMFRNVSKRAKKATRSILPPAISPQLVYFAVDGVLLLTSLSIVKAFLEVVCTLGGTVFAVILLLRVIWAMIFHFQSSGSSFNQGGTSYGTTQPAT